VEEADEIDRLAGDDRRWHQQAHEQGSKPRGRVQCARDQRKGVRKQQHETGVAEAATG
jgi:hypothetical protein